MDTATDATYYQPPGTVPASATQLVQLLATLASGKPSKPVTSSPPPAAAAPAPAPVPQAPNELEAARQQLDASSRQLAANLDDQWKKYLALPAEVYIPYHMPNIEVIEQAIGRYETVSEQPQYDALTKQPAFQSTLKSLWRLGELQHGSQQKFRLPPPPLGANQ